MWYIGYWPPERNETGLNTLATFKFEIYLSVY